MKNVLVTGGTGFVGAHVVRLLVKRGDRVFALVRPSSNMFLLQGQPVETVTGDITDLESLLRPLEDVDEVYHVAADYRLWARNPGEIYRNNTGGTRNVLEAAMRQGVPRTVYTSTVGCLGLSRNGSPADENTPVSRDELVGHYKKSKFDAQQVAEDYADRGLDVVIVNPSTPVGPGDVKPTPTGRIVLDYLAGRMPAYVDTGLNLIAVEDVARGHLLAAEKGKAGERYILGNRNVTLREMLCMLAAITGRKPPSVKIPHYAALAVAVADTLGCAVLGRQPGIPIDGVLMARKKMYFSSEKAVRELGLPQSPIEDALARSARWFADNSYLGR